uniref:J domain-containing protein n=1 Tax=Globodera pallida TaxID=36090 RepID=A0A183BJK8_GLOPA
MIFYPTCQPIRIPMCEVVARCFCERSNNATICWQCGGTLRERAESVLCPHCRRLQPLPAHADYFSYFGLDNPAGAATTIDETELKRRFRRMQSLVHPDKFAGRDERERNFSEQHSTFLNNAYRTLREPFARAQYLLELLETLNIDGAAVAASSSADRSTTTAAADVADEQTVEDSAVAAEMMELMESIEQMAPDSAAIEQRLVELDLEMYRLLRRANDQMAARDLSEARQTLRRLSYLRRSRRLLEAKRSGERWSGEHSND